MTRAQNRPKAAKKPANVMIKGDVSARADLEHDAIVSFIEKLLCLPISMQSNANQDYIEMGESIYYMAKKFFYEHGFTPKHPSQMEDE